MDSLSQAVRISIFSQSCSGTSTFRQEELFLVSVIGGVSRIFKNVSRIMGSVLCMFRDVFDRLSKKRRDIRVRLEGLDGVGKTTIFYVLKFGVVISPFPTIGWSIDTLNYKGLSFAVGESRESGGRQGLPSGWWHLDYFQTIDAFIFVVDSNDQDCIAECREELRQKVIGATAKSYRSNVGIQIFRF